jgi:hypothetical protein
MGVGLLAAAMVWRVDGVDVGGVPAGAGGSEAQGMSTGIAGAEGGEAAGGGEPADPWSAELPAAVRESLGVSTYAELRDRREQDQQLVAGYQELARAWGQAGGQGAPAAAAQAPAQQQQQGQPGGYMAWPSYQAFQAEFQANPEQADLKRMMWVMEKNQEKLNKGLEPAIQQRIAPLVQQATQQRLQAQQSDFVNRYPDAKRAEIVGDRSPVGRWMTQNESWLRELADSNPNVNVYEIAFKTGDYDRLKGELEALKKTAGSARAMAGVTRTNVGGATIPGRPKSHAEAIMRAVEDLRAKGQDVPQEMLDMALRAQQMAS